MGMFGVEQDSKLTIKMLETCGKDKGAAFKLGTGYFNPTEVT